MPTVDIISPGGAFSPAAVGDGVTDDAPAFRAFNTWAQAQTSPITLTLGTGSRTFLFNSSDSDNKRGNSPVYAVTQPITILGNGRSSSILKGGASVGFFMGAQNSIKSGNGNFGSVNKWTARINSVSAGATQVTCKNTGDAAQFSVNTWALITGIDMMKFGFPPNPFFFEYVYITAISSGVITFAAPLTNSYLDTWPVFSAGTAGLQPDEGGPATLYALDPAWNVDATYQSLGVDQSLTGLQTYATGRSIKFVDVKCFDTYGITPSNNALMSFTNCDLSSYQMEFDKVCDTVTFDSTTTGQLFFQSSNNRVVVQNGSTVTFNCTPRIVEVYNSTVAGLTLGAAGFGRTDSFTTSGSTFTGSFAYRGVVDNGDVSGGGIQADYTMTSGVIRMPKATIAYGCRWAIPGTYCRFTGISGGRDVDWGSMFKVTSVTEDATYVYVTTDWSHGGFPSWATNIKVHPCTSLNFASNTTSSIPEIINFKAQTAAGYPVAETYTTASLNGGTMGYDPGSFVINLPNVSGKLVSYTIDVTTPYTGVQSTLFWHAAAEFDNAIVVKPDQSTTTYGPHIDLKTAGRRVITPSGVTSFGADSGMSLADPDVWFTSFMNGLCANLNISSEYSGNHSVGPVFSVEIITEQGMDNLDPTAAPNKGNYALTGRAINMTVGRGKVNFRRKKN